MFNKVGGVTGFYPNRTIKGKRQIDQSSLQVTSDSASTNYYDQVLLVGSYTLYNDSKTDMYIRPNTNIPETGGYLIDPSGNDLFVYESIEKNTPESVFTSGERPYMEFTFFEDKKLTNSDSIWFNGIQYKFDTTKTTFTPASGGTPASFGVGDVSLVQQIQSYFSSQITANIPGYSSTYATSNNNYVIIYLDTYDTSRDNEQFFFDIDIEYLVSDRATKLAENTYRVVPFNKLWQLKGCFIPSDQYQYGFDNLTGNSVNKTTLSVTNNSTLYYPQYTLQLIDDPSSTHGVYFLQGGTINAKTRISNVYSGLSSTYSEIELLKSPGESGNSYTITVEDHPQLFESNDLDFPPRVEIRSNGVPDPNGDQIVVILGKRSPGNRDTVGNPTELMNAFRQGGLDPDEWIRFIYGPTSLSFTGPQGPYQFTGGIDNASDLIEEPGVEFSTSQVLKKYYTESFGLSSEFDSLGRSKIIDNDLPATRAGKHAGIFFNVVPAGNAFPARTSINFIEYTALVGGVSGNNISIIYQDGASLSVVDSGGDTVTVTLVNNTTTSQEIVNEINLSSNLVKARVFGNASQPQNDILALSPGINLENGEDALAADSGFFAIERVNGTSSSLDVDLISSTNRTRYLQIYHFTDIDDPSSYSYVTYFNWTALPTSTIDEIEGLIEVSRRYDATGPFFQLRLGAVQYEYRPQNARVRYSASTIIENLTRGFAGNREYAFEIVTGATSGNESIVIAGNGKDVTITVAPDTTAQKLIDIIDADGNLNTKFRIDTTNPSELINTTRPLVELYGGMEIWNYAGKVGFGYVTMEEIPHFFTTSLDSLWSTGITLSPVTFSTNATAISYIRAIDLSGTD